MDQKQGNGERIQTSRAPHYCSCTPEHVVDIPTDFNSARSSDCCIYKVPVNLRKVNPEAYTPQLIAIGPLHRKNPALEPMEMEKSRYSEFFWQRCQPKAQELRERYECWLVEKEQEIRHSYAVKFPEESEDSKKKFVEMILLDAVFIMELFLKFESWNPKKTRYFKENGDLFITNSWLRQSIARDLLLLENQIPMFVLEELYKTCFGKNPDFHKLADEVFGILHNESKKPSLTLTPSSKQLTDPSYGLDLVKSSKHFTDMMRYFLSFEKEKSHHPSDENTAADEKPAVLKTATQLNEGGVTFEKVKRECLLDVKFETKQFWRYFLCLSCLPKSPVFDCFKAQFKIPQLKVDHWTECIFRNLIALEQCHYPDKPYICNYVSLIDSLIHTKDDVELLVDKKVISHDLGSHKELATMVNGLCRYVVVNETCYQQTIEELNDHHKNSWNRAMAALRLVYFRDPWRASSTVVGVAVLVFTIFNFGRIVRVLF